MARREAGNTAEQAIAVPIFLSRVARLSAVRHDAHCLECVVQGSMAVPRSRRSKCSIELVREFLHALVQFFDLSGNQPSRITSSRRAVAERL